MTLVELECRGQRFALPLRCVQRVLPSAAPRPLPGAPEIVLGILNVEGGLVIVIDFFRRVGLSCSVIETSQQLVLVDMGDFRGGLIVDRVIGVTERDAESASGMPPRLAGADFVEAIVRLEDGLCIIVDPERFLFDHEKALLGDALETCDEKR
jgi:chemotaxis signal transduction protein